MKRVGDAANIGVIEYSKDARFQLPQVARVNEQRLSATVASSTRCTFIAREKPQTRGNLRIEKQLRRQRDHALDDIAFDHATPYFAFAARIAAHRTVGQNDTGATCGRKVMHDVRQPREIGVALRRRTVIRPANIAVELGMPPIGNVERRIGQHVIGAQIGMLIVEKRVGGFASQIEVDAANHEVHRHQTPRRVVAFLPVNRDVLFARLVMFGLVAFNKLFRLHEHSARTAARVVNASRMWRQNLHEYSNHRFGRVKLAAFLTFRAGELSQKILVNLTQNIACSFARAKADG